MFFHSFKIIPSLKSSVSAVCFIHFIRPIANMATSSPRRGFSVVTVARGWLPVFTSAVAGKTAASQASFPLNSTKISQGSLVLKDFCFYLIICVIHVLVLPRHD